MFWRSFRFRIMFYLKHVRDLTIYSGRVFRAQNLLLTSSSDYCYSALGLCRSCPDFYLYLVDSPTLWNTPLEKLLLNGQCKWSKTTLSEVIPQFPNTECHQPFCFCRLLLCLHLLFFIHKTWTSRNGSYFVYRPYLVSRNGSSSRQSNTSGAVHETTICIGRLCRVSGPWPCLLEIGWAYFDSAAFLYDIILMSYIWCLHLIWWNDETHSRTMVPNNRYGCHFLDQRAGGHSGTPPPFGKPCYRGKKSRGIDEG